MIASLRTILSLGRQLARWFGGPDSAATGAADPQAAEAMRRAREAHQGRRPDEARALYRHVLQRWPHHADALRGLRDLAIEARDWDEAVAVQQRLIAVAGPSDREIGRAHV